MVRIRGYLYSSSEPDAGIHTSQLSSLLPTRVNLQVWLIQRTLGKV